jgi:glycosyltransferase involved in cell wall biosynthesis
MEGRSKVMDKIVEKEPAEIVHVVARYPPALGGMEKVAEGLAQTQYELGIKVRVLTSDDGLDGREAAKSAFPVLRLKSFSTAHTPVMPGLLPSLLRLTAESKIHLHISAAYTPEMVWVYARLRSCPYIAHVHLDVLPSGPAGFLLKPYQKVLLRHVLHGARAVVVPTDDYREIISRKYGIAPGRIAVIHNGCWHRVASKAKSLAKSGDKKRLLFVGRLSVQKNLPLLLDAMAVYLRKYGDAELAIVGDGEERPAVQSRIQRLGIGNAVTMLGPVFDDELESIYAASDLFIMTSVNESFGLVFIEAMRKGLPIVSVDIPAVRNVVHNGINGLLAESAAESIAEAIRTLSTDEILYATISRNNLAKSQEYNWVEIAEKFKVIYDSIRVRK